MRFRFLAFVFVGIAAVMFGEEIVCTKGGNTDRMGQPAQYLKESLAMPVEELQKTYQIGAVEELGLLYVAPDYGPQIDEVVFQIFSGNKMAYSSGKRKVKCTSIKKTDPKPVSYTLTLSPEAARKADFYFKPGNMVRV